MKKGLFVLLILLLTFKTYGQTESWAEGLKKHNEGDYPGAIKIFTNEIDNDLIKNDSVALSLIYEYRADAKNQLKDFRGVILDLDKAILLRNEITIESKYEGGIEDLSKLYFLRGATKFQLNFPLSEQMNDLNYSIKLNPKNGKAYAMRGIIKVINGQKEGGCLDLSKAGELGVSEAYQGISQFCV
jgi:hypothetical protein